MSLKIMQIYHISGNYANYAAILNITFMQISKISFEFMQNI